jgi:hypothetical protein
MKKLILSLVVLVSGIVAAEPMSVVRSSYVAGATQSGCIQALFITGLVAGEATTGGNVMLINSSWTTVASSSAPVLSSATLATAQSIEFYDANVKGICYVADTPTNGFTIFYRK